MQELEKILEEIDKATDEYGMVDYINDEPVISKKQAKDIIRKHMNDGWIPVEEALPEEGQEAWVTENTDCVRRGTYTEIFGSAMRKGFICSDGFMYIGNAFAWQPYIVPEPYRPERSMN